MDSEHWEQVKVLFDGAHQLEPAQRGSYLDRHCQGQPALRAEVESLLLQCDAGDTFMMDPPLGQGALSPLLREDPAANVPTITMENQQFLLKDRYELLQKLSHGGMGVVYLARDNTLHDKKVVIKIPLSTNLEEAWVAGKFAQEVRALSLIDHPGVVGVYDSGLTPDGKPFFVMQYVEGRSLRTLILPGGLEFGQCADIVRQIGQALGAAHEKHIWHRDLKPENVMLQTISGGQMLVKLIDFGIATITEKDRAETETLVAGTVAYMAPEQLEGRVSRTTDIYSFGVIAYELLAGAKPFMASSAVELHKLQAAGVSVSISSLRPDVPSAAESLVVSALSFRSEDRPQDAAQFGTALAEALLPQQPAVASKIAPRRRALLIGALAVAFLGPAGGFIWIAGNRRGVASLSYSILVLKGPGARPQLAHFGTPFEGSDAFTLLVRATRSGHLYMLSDDSGSGSLNNLFPAPFMYNGSSAITADQAIQVPERSWFHFDPQSAILDLWLLWSQDPVAQLEALQKWMNPQDRGSIAGEADRKQVRALLEAAAKNTRIGSRTPTEESATTTGPLLAWKIRLQTKANG